MQKWYNVEVGSKIGEGITDAKMARAEILESR